MPAAKVSVKGQIVLPAELRRRHGIRPGMTVQVVDAADHIVIVTSAADPVRDLRGLLSGGDSLIDALLEERRAERARE